MIGIIGGGFGLYGWLPALCQFYPNETILLEERHKEKFDKRPELQQYKDRIEWKHGFDVVKDSELLIMAIPPSKVYHYLEFITDSRNIKKLIVEKPVCETPEKSEQFIKAIEDKGIKICSSYLFLYTNWSRILLQNSQYIKWDIKNNNLKDSWKHNNIQGGGPLKFYGIHLLAVMVSLNYDYVIHVESKKPDSIYILLSKGEDTFSIEINSNSEEPKFELMLQYPKIEILNINHPFPEFYNEEDNRIPYIKDLLNDFENNYNKVNSLMHKTNSLWKTVEQKLN